jgi:hypothetical protein
VIFVSSEVFSPLRNCLMIFKLETSKH